MNIVISELINAIGAAFFVFLFIVRVMQFSAGDLIAIPLALQSALAATKPVLLRHTIPGKTLTFAVISRTFP